MNAINKHMFRNSIITCVSSIFLLGACSDKLDVTPKDQVSDATLWTSTNNADLFLNNIYGTLPGPMSMTDSWEHFSDNAIAGVAGQYSATVFGQANYNASNGPNLWGYYYNIRKANLFLARVEASSLPDDWKKKRAAEARFLRAYFYSILWNYYGGVPLITKVLNLAEQGDEVFYARSTSEETMNFIVKELDEISPDLLLKPETGRISRGAALTLKAWCQLYMASPLYNTNGDLAKWKVAADAYKAVMNLGVYNLFTDYNSLFLEENNNNEEVIFDKPYYRSNGMTGTMGPSYVGMSEYRGYGYSNPTQELVNDYLMSNGKAISDPTSGYNPKKPYEGRERRFYADIIYDGSEWIGLEMIMKQGVGSKSATDLSNLNEATNTGYYWRKLMDPKYAFVGNSQNSAHFILFRYAEVLLGYAEAQNEFAGPDESVYAAINMVRKRVDLPILSGLNKEGMRKAIQRERRVELTLEDKRYLDLLRWKQAEEKLNGVMHAVVIKKENNEWVYSYVPAPGGTHAFYANKNYFFPIPQQALDQNNKLKQNPNY
ncbi:RagB/SusD family nutrient uptake outer membrane protein [Sphingobacterium humi]|uniref:RagB/SusD family nutrient uptake outer membrane protein n=1 Tax=Sphingobacterium humi TaxID=1796905 RepID=A0A6N8KV97_9SPHI|nr:RagB/SusD family nutrient uptake outer membrane protein [Sphingobacterium humi]MVZ60619.1 RagB/SusD family nutrient uptake outer membrane protein [Sphingobacterium humi]